jgi:hypothetical protein
MAATSLWFALWLINASPTPPSLSPVQEKANAYVHSIDTPISAADWKALGPEGAAFLDQLANDASLLPTRRARAVSGLAFCAGTGARATAQKLANNSSEPLTVRLSALRALPVVMSNNDLVAATQPLLERDPDARIRAAAAEVLAKQGTAGPCGLVTAQLQKETSRTQPLFARAAKSCAASH